MKSFLKGLVVMLAIFGACILLTPVFAKILPMFKFEKIFNRLIMIFVISAAFLSIRRQKIDWKFYGFDFTKCWKRLFAWGFLGGFLMVFAITVIECLWGPRSLRDNITFLDILQRFFKGMLSGVAVGIIEEFFFRGFIFSSLEQKIKSWPALFATSAFYSLVHFFDNGQIFIPENPGIKDAARLLVGYLEPFYGSFYKIWPDFLGLFLFGIALNIAYMRSRSIFPAMGIHAGTVFCIKFQNAFLNKGENTSYLLYGGSAHYDGLAEWGMLILFAIILFFVIRRQKAPSAS